MEWVAKKKIIAISFTSLIAISLSLVVVERTHESDSPSPAERNVLATCFNSRLSTIDTFSVSSNLPIACPEGSLSLGVGALEIETSTPISSVHPLLELRFQAARALAELDGVHLYITSGFRSKSRQAYLFEREVAIRGSESEAAKWVLPPQYSHHPQGLALDINYPGDPAGAHWLELHGYLVGLCRVYANEWWHFEGATHPGIPCPALAPNALVDIP